MSIRSKLISYSIIIAIIPVIITASFSFQKAEISLKEKTFSHLETASVLKEEEIRLWMREVMSSLSFLQRIFQKELIQWDDKNLNETTHEQVDSLLQVLLAELQNQHPEFREIFLINAEDGKVYLSTDIAQLNKEKQTRPYFTEGKKGVFVQSFYFSPEIGQMTNLASAPIYNDSGEVIFVIAARLNMEFLNQIMLEKSGLGATGETYLVNSDHLAITPLKNEEAKSSMGIYTEGVNNCLGGIDGEGLYNDYRGIKVIGSYRWIEELSVCVVSEINESEAFHDIKLLQQIILIIASIIISIAVFTGLITSLTFTRPINRLISIAKSISEGDFRKKVDKEIIHEKNEIGLLARTLNKMQQELNRTISETQKIIETMPSALLLLDSEGGIKMANITAKELLRITEAEIKDTKFETFLDEKNELTSSFKKKKFKEVKNFNTKITTKAGEKINVTISIAKIKKDKNYPGGLIVVVQDIRELKRYAKKRINEITPILNQLSLGDFAATLNLPDQDDEFSDLIVAVNLMTDNLKELITENKKKTAEIEASQKNLTLSHTKLLKAKDIIESEKAKAETLLSSIGEGILAINKSGNILMINRVAEDMFGTPMTDSLNKNFQECCQLIDEKGLPVTHENKYIKDVIDKQKTFYMTTYHKKLSGRSIPFATTFAPIIIGNHSAGLIATFRDISKEKEVDQAKTEFVSLASHQLRTPLTAIKWILEDLMRNESLSKHQIDYLQDALKSNARMIALVNDLLNVSRLETGKISVTSERIVLQEVILQVIKEAKPLCLVKKQIIEFLKPPTTFSIEADPQLLRQVLSNIISNAIKYSDDNTTITVKLIQKKTKAVISISDQGIGVPKKLQSRLFQKFFRTGEAIRRSTSGSGLGLYIIKKVVDSMHGDIGFKSEEGKGSSFFVSLPLKGPVTKGDVKKLIEHRVS